MMNLLETRVYSLNEKKPGPGPVLIWMSRDQRIPHNWALVFAQQQAEDRGVLLHVSFCLAPEFLNAPARHYRFMLKGLREVELECRNLHIPFHLVQGDPGREIPALARRIHAGEVITDFDPLRIKQQWQTAVAAALDMPLWEVDAHNVVPCRYCSHKQEFGAQYLRRKIHAKLFDFLTPIPSVKPQPAQVMPEAVDWDNLTLDLDESVKEVDWIKPGAAAGEAMLDRFVKRGLRHYPEKRNDPNLDGQSNLSPYLHFGQISAQYVAWKALQSEIDESGEFLEELIVRRELADNFCLYNAHYDSVEGYPNWAKTTLLEHRDDPREFVYGLDAFEHGQTHDSLWNAAQNQMVQRGKMHGYMRMYWAKKILEWTDSVETAMQIAIFLNDKYSLDGRDPNGYTGIAWSLGGVHDRAWAGRPVFGKIRYMNANGCRRKFDVGAYIRRFRD